MTTEKIIENLNTPPSDGSEEQPKTLLNQQAEGDDAGKTQTTDGEPQGPSGEDGDTSSTKEDSKPEPRAPETYELGAGEDVPAETVQAVEQFARANDLTNDQAKAVLAARLEQSQAFQAAQIEAFNAKVDKWADEVKADPDIGGNKLEATIGDAKRAMDHFATDKFRDTLEESGLGSHPEVVRMMAKIGRAMREGDYEQSNRLGKPNSRKSDEEVFYPDMKQ